MALVRISTLPDPSAADLGEFPYALGWTVYGPQGKEVGQVVDIYMHDDTGGAVSLAIEFSAAKQVFNVPAEEVEVNPQARSVKVHRNLSEFGERLRRVHDRPLLLRAFLGDYGVDEDTIDALEAAGILTMEQLHALVERGGLPPLLGPARRSQAREVERVIRQQRR